MMEIVGSDRDKFKELQTDVTRYMLTEVRWRRRNEARRTKWFFWFPRIKTLV